METVQSSEADFLNRYEGLTHALLDPIRCYSGFVTHNYMILNKKVNGLYTYKRKAKFDPALFTGLTLKRQLLRI